jgi:hypothetical protein
MKYTKEELIAAVANATQVETYEYVGKNHRIHTDTVKYIGNSCFDNSEIEALPFDENGEIDVDVEIMGEEDYNNTILANTGSYWSDMYEADDKVAVIVIR